MRGRWLGFAFSRTLTLACSRPVHRRRFSSATADGADAGVAVKKVTSSNFEPALEELRVRVREADFVAIDLEMTGITSAPWRDAFEFDRSDVRYLKVKDSAEKFTVVQCGVCPFRWDGAKGSFIAHP
ncbi:putative Poly(A)-specific ribonuclease PARN-like [Cocos nucifera]|uniref:Putative Poly(A)-specific ribonuclease PARN-like n=1 Tax=Cocos nucifera TaxID=13894 RepID=A0A8K0IG34_COCNU|nr:putative Poly(A)-specific ribonuclease PARN-like [Cocos nucifera]